MANGEGDLIRLATKLESGESPSATIAKISRYGFCWLPDQIIGNYLEDLQERSFQIDPRTMLETYEQLILRNELIRGIIEKVFEQSRLGLFRVFGEWPGHVVSFASLHAPQERANIHIVVVQLWKKNSEVIFHSASHNKVATGAQEAGNGLFDIPKTTAEGYTAVSIPFDLGGVSIIEFSTWFQVPLGRGIFCGFASSGLVEFLQSKGKWDAVFVVKPAQDTEEVRQMIERVQCKNIKVVFKPRE